ncbi:DNA polymerase II [Undibacterium sp.]|uniref:DNA polymerase II n=1 Tax=Undibacterium sp. TaxID=1914977 RepID=UPI00374CA9D0
MNLNTRTGFILTRHWRDTADGTEIEFWVATDQGPRNILARAQTSVAFAAAEHREQIESLLVNAPGSDIQALALKTFQQEPVIGIYCRQYRHITRLETALMDRGIRLHEADVRPHERFMMERFITASVQIEGGEENGATILDCKLKPVSNYRPALNMVSIDIETSAHEDLYSIAVEGCGDRRVFMLGTAPAEQPECDFVLEYYDTQKQMLEQLNEWFRVYDPDVIIGWSVVQFDLRVLHAHAEKLKVPLIFGRAGKPMEWRRHSAKKSHYFASAPGRLIIDGIEGLRAAMWSFPSFSLENVAQTMLGEGKSIDNPYDRMEEIERRFHEDKPALARYNLKDCELVTRIFAKAGLLEFAMERANATGLQADHFGGSIASFSHLYLPRMHREGYVAPNIGEIPGTSYPGGFVMDSQPGIYDSVLVLDYKSLYPSIIRTFLIDPIGLIEGQVAKDPADTVPGPNGTIFSRTRHCLPEIVRQIWQGRDAAKKEKNESLSQALKLLMNALAGVLGASECRFFNPDLVSAITLNGHWIMKQTRILVEEAGYDAIYGDTDSIFVWLKRGRSEAEAHEVADRLVGKVNQWWKEHLKTTLGLECWLELEFDTHYQKFFMPTIRGEEYGSKKRYAGLVVQPDGTEEIVYRGLETVRSDWTPLAQQFQQALLMRVFKGQPYREFVLDYTSKTLSGEFDALMVYRKRLRRQLDGYQTNVPPHVRAARLADDYNEKHNRPKQYQNGGWINYVISVNGPAPTEIAGARIDYQHYLSKQLQPIADAILAPLHDSFASITNVQGSLF